MWKMWEKENKSEWMKTITNTDMKIQLYKNAWLINRQINEIATQSVQTNRFK